MDAINPTGINMTEMISLRGLMSIYAGWLSAASILGMGVFLQSLGMTDENGYNETAWSVAMLWVALAIYAANTYVNSDPLFGAVFIWVGLGIRDNDGDGPVEALTVSNLNVIIPLIAAFDLYVLASNLGLVTI